MDEAVERAAAIMGMMEPGELQWLYEIAKSMNSIVEIGSYKGRSTYALLSGCPGPVYAVDFFSCGGMWPDTDPQSDTWPAFFVNVGHFPNLHPVRMTSAKAAAFGPVPPLVDMVFIDGCHDFAAVFHDLNLWEPRATKMICGHDWDPLTPGVEEALKKFCGMEGVARGAGKIWHIKKER